MGIILREYQESFKEDLRQTLRSNSKVIGVLPTGGGKTVVFASIVAGAIEKGKKVLIITDRIELLTQGAGALNNLGFDATKIEAGNTRPNLNRQLYVGMIETINRRMDKGRYNNWLKGIDLVIIDECHKRAFTKLFEHLSEDVKVLGFTATPVRQGHGDPLTDHYTALVNGVDISYLVSEGFLAYPNYYGVKVDLAGVRTKRGDYDQEEVASRFSQSKLYKGVVDNWQRHTPNTKTLVFSSNIANSLEIVDEFKSIGCDVRHLDSKMPKRERESILRWFKHSKNGVLANVGILTTGFDEPTIETVVLYRATKSLSLYLQMVGRGSRTISGIKTEFNILDFGNNKDAHGFWHDPRDWKLEVPKPKRQKGEAVLKNCPNCEAFIAASTVVCPECGHEDIKEKKAQEMAQLELLNPSDKWRAFRRANVEDKGEMVKAKVLKGTAVMHQRLPFTDLLKIADIAGYKRSWFEVNCGRYWWNPDYQKNKNEVLAGKKLYDS